MLWLWLDSIIPISAIPFNALCSLWPKNYNTFVDIISLEKISKKIKTNTNHKTSKKNKKRKNKKNASKSLWIHAKRHANIQKSTHREQPTKNKCTSLTDTLSGVSKTHRHTHIHSSNPSIHPSHSHCSNIIRNSNSRH